MKNETTQPSATEQALAKIEFTDAKAFESIVAAINGLADKYRGLQITDTASYKVVVSGIAEMRGLRIAVENRRKEKKADILAAGRQIDGGAKKIAELLWPIENDLKATRQTEDTKKDAIRIEKEQAEKERIESIQSKIAAFPPDVSKLPQLLKMTAPEIQAMQDALAAVEIDIEIYQEFTPEAIKTKHEKKVLLGGYYVARIQADNEAAKQKAETDRIEQVRKEQEAKEEIFRQERVQLENERLAEIEVQRIAAEKVRVKQEEALKKQEEEQKAKQKIEDDRLAKIREQQKAEAQKLRDAQTKIDAQEKAIQERERIEQERLAQIERDRITKIETERQEQVRIKKEAAEKIEREKAEAEEKARQEALRPDKKVLEIYLNDLSSNINMRKVPHMQTTEGKVVLSFIQTQIEKIFDDSLKKLKEM